jgi:hypothetical protein
MNLNWIKKIKYETDISKVKLRCFIFLNPRKDQDLSKEIYFKIFCLEFKFVQILEVCYRFKSIWKLEKDSMSNGSNLWQPACAQEGWCDTGEGWWRSDGCTLLWTGRRRGISPAVDKVQLQAEVSAATSSGTVTCTPRRRSEDNGPGGEAAVSAAMSSGLMNCTP